MPTLLYHFPGSCSRVVLHVLEEIGLDYGDRGVQLLQGEQRQPEFQAINPKGKVPTLVVDDVVITELPVIIRYLADAHPDAALLPGSGAAGAVGLSDLIWCAGSIHPIAHRMFRPQAYTEGDPAAVKAAALTQFHAAAAKIDRRLHDGSWWFGEAWSPVDSYLAWIFGGGRAFGFPLDDYPAIDGLVNRVTARPAWQRALLREQHAVTRDSLELLPASNG